MSWTTNALPFPPELFVALFVIVFPFFWIAILGVIAVTGWRKVEAQYPATSDPPPTARQVRFANLNLGGSMASPNYGGCITAWLSEMGLWLRPILPFRPFHPMIFIPWARVQSVESERAFLASRVRVKLAGNVPDLLLNGALGEAVLERSRAGRSRRI